jgi:hypothetical protein
MNPYDKTTYTIEGWDNHLLPVPLPTIQTTTVIDGVTYLLMGPEVLRKALSLGHPIQGEAEQVGYDDGDQSGSHSGSRHRDNPREAMTGQPIHALPMPEYLYQAEPVQSASGLASQPPTPAGVREITEEAQIKHMVDRFLAWKLPENFRPDGGVSFDPIGNAGTTYEFHREPMGTNLLDATQAEAMVRHMLEGLPSPATADSKRQQAAICTALLNAYPMADKIADNYAAVAVAALAAAKGAGE